jgi:hypothetical protein
LGYGRD